MSSTNSYTPPPVSSNRPGVHMKNVPRKVKFPNSAPQGPALEWDPNSAEPWFVDFEKEPVNDDKWNCIVTAAIPSETRDEDCIQTYNHFVSRGLRKVLRIISMADIVALLKENVGTKGKKEDENPKTVKSENAKRNTVYFSPTSSQLLDMVSKYATFTDTECKLPPDLMAALVKFLILKLKRENSFEKAVEAVRAKKIRRGKIKARFVRSLRPYEMTQETDSMNVSQSMRETEEPINDHPLDGPDLYIMLVDFYDVSYFPEMLRIHIPFLAILKITTRQISETYERVPLPSAVDPEGTSRRRVQMNTFWKNLKAECMTLEKTAMFKDIALMQYMAPKGYLDSKQYLRTIFDELTWMQYSAFCIYRQHQKYLQEMYVQRLVVSLEPLDLSKCNVYNKLCDALIMGEPLTPLMVLYAIVEQVVAGVPHTKSTALEYLPKSTNFFSRSKKSVGKMAPTVVISATGCKARLESTGRHRDNVSGEGNEAHVYHSESHISTNRKNVSSSVLFLKPMNSSETFTSEAFIDQVLTEQKLENENKGDKKWKTPVLCFHADSVFRQTFYCDPRLFQAETVVRRFLTNSDFFPIWSKYPELSAEEKAFFNYHFFSLWKISQQRQDLLKLKVFFTLSAKLIGLTKSYAFGRESETVSDDVGKKSRLSKVEIGGTLVSVKEAAADFYDYFLKTFIDDLNSWMPRKATINFSNGVGVSFSVKAGSQLLEKTAAHLSAYKIKSRNWAQGISNLTRGRNIKTSSSPLKEENGYGIISSLLECPEISNLADTHLLLDNEDYSDIIKRFKFYEKLEPNLMVQKLLEAGRCYNTFRCSYFPPTDTIVITMYDSFDQRGVFHSPSSGALPTPLGLRDFFSYVYPEIIDWLVKECAENSKYVAELADKIKAQEDKEDAEYLDELQRTYCEMTPKEREEFLEFFKNIRLEPEVTEDELDSLPVKLKPLRRKRISFTTVNFSDVRVENYGKVYEFHSRDGTKVRVTLDNWLHSPLHLLSLEIKREDFLLHYNQWLDQETNTAFTFKTVSDLIFAFTGNLGAEGDFKYNLTISWPTGLLIEPIWTDSTLYVKQGYLKSCGNGWNPEEEDSRCFLKNGRIIVFKSNGDYDVLCSSGTKYSYYGSVLTPRYETISTTGEVWEYRARGSYRSRRKTRSRIFLGVDSKTHESFYKRDDGTQCMLWQNGVLVTTYLDGTKITATPYFDEDEIDLEWTEEEKVFFEKLVQSFKSEQSVQEPRSRTILRNSSMSKSAEIRSTEFEGFVSVSCAYLMEHPKYSTIYVNPSNPYLKVTLPENLSVLIYSDGTYEVQQENHFLRVYNGGAEFQSICNSCEDSSTVKLNLDSSEILCSCTDFFRKAFFVLRNGEISFQEFSRESEGGKSLDPEKKEKSPSSKICTIGHAKSAAANQRCFALERDLSGIEFLHEDCFTLHASQMPGDTYHEEHPDEAQEVNHTFSSYCYGAGYEKWVMKYEDEFDSLPVNIKKKDLRELGVKQVTKNLFQYPFPKHCTHASQQRASQQPTGKVRTTIKAPKLVVTRSFLSLPGEPDSVIKEVHKYITAYQNRAQELYKTYLNRKTEVFTCPDSKHVEMRLRKIALILSQSLNMYPHLCTQLPSTEKDIHYFGHFIKAAEDLKCQIPDSLSVVPKCKQLPIPLPRSSEFPSINEQDTPTIKKNV